MTESVVLLHGLARTPRSMAKLAKRLEADGYHVVNQGYPSRVGTVAELSEEAFTEALAQCPVDARLHVVTHSMGALLLRAYLREHDLPQLRRVVMLGPPNGGSEVVDQIGDLLVFEWVNGPAGRELGTSPTSAPSALGPFTHPAELGIIAGTRTINPILSVMIEGANDGKVSVENTKLDGMDDHITVPVAHPFLMTNDDAIEQVIHFLQHGCFARD